MRHECRGRCNLAKRNPRKLWSGQSLSAPTGQSSPSSKLITRADVTNCAEQATDYIFSPNDCLGILFTFADVIGSPSANRPRLRDSPKTISCHADTLLLH